MRAAPPPWPGNHGTPAAAPVLNSSVIRLTICRSGEFAERLLSTQLSSLDTLAWPVPSRVLFPASGKPCPPYARVAHSPASMKFDGMSFRRLDGAADAPRPVLKRARCAWRSWVVRTPRIADIVIWATTVAIPAAPGGRGRPVA